MCPFLPPIRAHSPLQEKQKYSTCLQSDLKYLKNQLRHNILANKLKGEYTTNITMLYSYPSDLIGYELNEKTLFGFSYIFSHDFDYLYATLTQALNKHFFNKLLRKYNFQFNLSDVTMSLKMDQGH